MAFLRIKPNSRFFVAGWKDENGKRIARLTKIVAKQGTRRQAQRIADEFEKVSRARRAGRQVREVISDLHKELTGEAIAQFTCRQYVEQFLTRKRGETGTATIAFYKRAFEDFLTWLGPRADDDIAGILPADIATFRLALLEKVSETTITNKIKALRALFSSALKEGIILDEPTSHLRLRRKAVSQENTVEKRAFSIQEIKTLINGAEGEWRSMMIFGIYTGQRLGDLATLKWSQIDTEGKSLTIETRKTGRHVNIRFSRDLERHVKTLQRGTSPFVHPSLGEQYEKHGASTLSNQFSSILANCGLREPVSHRAGAKGRSGKRRSSELSFHSFRITAVTFLHAEGIPAAAVQEWVGHDSIEVHRIYVRLGEETMSRASNSLPSFVPE